MNGSTPEGLPAPRLLPFERAFREWIDRHAMGWEQLRIPSSGVTEDTTAYRFTPAGPPRGTVLTLHGAGNDALFAWVGLFKRLLLRGSAIFTFDLPGHGRRNETRFATETAVPAVHTALAECTRSTPDLPVHAVGVSLGGALLLGALPVVQERLAAAALIVTPLRIHLSARSLMREIGARNLSMLWRERSHYGLTGLIPSFGPFRRGTYPLRLQAEVPAGMFGYVSTLNDALAALELPTSAQAVRLPVLLAYGERDRIVDISQGEHLADHLTAGELLRVPGGTHLSTPLEPIVVERLVSWIENHE